MQSILRSATIGVASGVRSVTPPAAVSWAAATGRLRVPDRFSLLSQPNVASFLGFSALAEILVDKLPFVPTRTRMPFLAWRIATGALLGAVLAAADNESVLLGGAAGATGAASGAYGGVAVRAALTRLPGLSEPFTGIVGDVASVALSLWAVED